MIIGSGMIAKAFEDYAMNDEILIFASGVSNSKENSNKTYQREADLLKKTISENPEKTLIYFSTCSIDDPSMNMNQYVVHKLKMETLISHSCQSYYIFRISQIVGHTNSPTIINYFKNKILNHESFEVWKNSDRNLIAIEDVYKIVHYCIIINLFKNQITNIATPYNTNILEIIEMMEKLLSKKAMYSILEFGNHNEIDISKITPYLKNANVNFTETYTEDIIKIYLERETEHE